MTQELTPLSQAIVHSKNGTRQSDLFKEDKRITETVMGITLLGSYAQIVETLEHVMEQRHLCCIVCDIEKQSPPEDCENDKKTYKEFYQKENKRTKAAFLSVLERLGVAHPESVNYELAEDGVKNLFIRFFTYVPRPDNGGLYHHVCVTKNGLSEKTWSLKDDVDEKHQVSYLQDALTLLMQKEWIEEISIQKWADDSEETLQDDDDKRARWESYKEDHKDIYGFNFCGEDCFTRGFGLKVSLQKWNRNDNIAVEAEPSSVTDSDGNTYSCARICRARAKVYKDEKGVFSLVPDISFERVFYTESKQIGATDFRAYNVVSSHKAKELRKLSAKGHKKASAHYYLCVGKAKKTGNQRKNDMIKRNIFTTKAYISSFAQKSLISLLKERSAQAASIVYSSLATEFPVLPHIMTKLTVYVDEALLVPKEKTEKSETEKKTRLPEDLKEALLVLVNAGLKKFSFYHKETGTLHSPEDGGFLTIDNIITFKGYDIHAFDALLTMKDNERHPCLIIQNETKHKAAIHHDEITTGANAKERMAALMEAVDEKIKKSAENVTLQREEFHGLAYTAYKINRRDIDIDRRTPTQSLIISNIPFLEKKSFRKESGIQKSDDLDNTQGYDDSQNPGDIKISDPLKMSLRELGLKDVLSLLMNTTDVNASNMLNAFWLPMSRLEKLSLLAFDIKKSQETKCRKTKGKNMKGKKTYTYNASWYGDRLSVNCPDAFHVYRASNMKTSIRLGFSEDSEIDNFDDAPVIMDVSMEEAPFYMPSWLPCYTSNHECRFSKGYTTESGGEYKPHVLFQRPFNNEVQHVSPEKKVKKTKKDDKSQGSTMIYGHVISDDMLNDIDAQSEHQERRRLCLSLGFSPSKAGINEGIDKAVLPRKVTITLKSSDKYNVQKISQHDIFQVILNLFSFNTVRNEALGASTLLCKIFSLIT